MPRYAEHECADCGVVLPSNELYRTTVRVLSSVSRSNRLYSGTRGGLGVGGSTRQTFRIRQIELCPDCYQDRINVARRARFWRAIGAIAVVGFGALLLVAMSNGSHSKATDTPVAANSVMPDNTIDSAATVSDNQSALEAPTPTATPTEPVVSPSPTQVGGGMLVAPTDDAIRSVTLNALATGQTKPWHENGDHGFVVVSDVQVYPDRTCRNLYTTVSTPDGDNRSPSQMWCQANGGADWAPTR